MGNIGGIIAAIFIIMATVYVGAREIGRLSVAHDCINYGETIVTGLTYQCHPGLRNKGRG